MKKMIELLAEYGVGLMAAAAAVLFGIGAALIFAPGAVLAALRWILAAACAISGIWLLAALIAYWIGTRRRTKDDSCSV